MTRKNDTSHLRLFVESCLLSPRGSNISTGRELDIHVLSQIIVFILEREFQRGKICGIKWANTTPSLKHYSQKGYYFSFVLFQQFRFHPLVDRGNKSFLYLSGPSLLDPGKTPWWVPHPWEPNPR